MSKFKVFSLQEKQTINSIISKVVQGNHDPKFRIITFTQLYRKLKDSEKKLVNRIRQIDPTKFGFRGHYLGKQRIPKNLVILKNQIYLEGGKQIKIREQYLPKLPYLALEKLNKQLKADTGHKLLVSSGYRSPAYQILLILRYLKLNNYDLNHVLKRVSTPDYSEHCSAVCTAVDFMTTAGHSSNSKNTDFVKTSEYKWLLKNAARFGFYLSYPKNNKLGVIFEPWHWHFEALK